MKKCKVVAKAVEVHRDEFGVPHIYARSMEDLYKSYGYVMAQDRLFQLEMFKRANEGTAAAVFGEDYLAHDESIRRDGYTDEAVQKMIDEMEPYAKETLKTFQVGLIAMSKRPLRILKEIIKRIS